MRDGAPGRPGRAGRRVPGRRRRDAGAAAAIEHAAEPRRRRRRAGLPGRARRRLRPAGRRPRHLDRAGRRCQALIADLAGTTVLRHTELGDEPVALGGLDRRRPWPHGWVGLPTRRRLADGRQLTGEVTELLQQLIRNPASTTARRSRARRCATPTLLRDLPRGRRPRRRALRADARPALARRPHRGQRPVRADAVPDGPHRRRAGDPDGWTRDPFGGELVDGEVWGRGAIDMLNLTASMAVASKHLAAPGLAAEGHADLPRRRRRGGRRRTTGAEWIVRPRAGRGRVRTTCSPRPAGWTCDGPAGAEGRRSPSARRASPGGGCASRGTPGHGSMPFGADNALVKAAEVVRRLADVPAGAVDRRRCGGRYVDSLDLDADDPAQALVDPARVSTACRDAARPAARQARPRLHAHDVLAERRPRRREDEHDPRRRRLEVDIRTLPGETDDDVDAHARATRSATRRRGRGRASCTTGDTESPTDTPLWDALERARRQRVYPDATLLPAHDRRRHRRPLLPRTGIGGLRLRAVLPDVTYEEFARFHGNDERIDVESLGLTTQLLARGRQDVLG